MRFSGVLTFLFFFITCCVLFISSCKHEPFVPIDTSPNDFDTVPTNPGHPCSPDSVYFLNDILPLVISNCSKSGCHDSFTHQQGLTLTSYENIMKIVKPGDPSLSKLYRMITMAGINDRMPPPGNTPLTSGQIDLIKKWIQQGALNNSCGDGFCDTASVTYSGTISTIINMNCKGCHSGITAGGGLNFSTITPLQTVALDGRLHGAIHHISGYVPMPQNGSLNDCNIQKIDIWINDGAPNN